MQEHNRITGAYLYIGHFPPQDVHTLLLVREFCADHDTFRPFFSEGLLSPDPTLSLSLRSRQKPPSSSGGAVPGSHKARWGHVCGWKRIS